MSNIFILSNTDKGCHCCFVSCLKHAFYTAIHEFLINKLQSFEIKGSEHSWFVSYLNNRVQAVNIGHSMSHF